MGVQSSISPIFPPIPHSFPILLSIFWRIFTGLLLGGGSTQDFSSLFPYLPIFSRLFPFSFHFLENIYLAVTRRGPNSVFPLSFPIFSHYSLHFLENIHKAVTRQRLNPVFPPFHIFPLFFPSSEGYSLCRHALSLSPSLASLLLFPVFTSLFSISLCALSLS